MEDSPLCKLTIFSPPQPDGFPDLAQESMMEGICTSTYEEGYSAGHEEAVKEAQTERVMLDKTIIELTEQLNLIIAEMEQAQNRILYKIFSALLPVFCQTMAGAEIIDIANKAVGETLKGQLTVTGNKNLLGQLRAQKQDLSNFNLREDTSLSDGSARLDWQGGGGAVDLEATMNSCLQALQREEKIDVRSDLNGS